jgi:hypothetical protein
MLKLHPSLRSLPPAALVSVFTSLALLLLYAFQWSIIDLITPFLFLPLQGLLWLMFVGASVWSVVYWIRNRRLRQSWIPFLICGLSVCLVMTVPFTDLWLQYDFRIRRNARERIVQEVLERKLGPALEDSRMPKLVTLPRGAPRVSMGGNEILALMRDGKTYVFFFTYRGILRNYAGFLYVPTDGNPAAFADLNEQSRTWIDRYDEHWFFASHR